MTRLIKHGGVLLISFLFGLSVTAGATATTSGEALRCEKGSLIRHVFAVYGPGSGTFNAEDAVRDLGSRILGASEGYLDQHLAQASFGEGPDGRAYALTNRDGTVAAILTTARTSEGRYVIDRQEYCKDEDGQYVADSFDPRRSISPHLWAADGWMEEDG